MITVIERTWIS